MISASSTAADSKIATPESLQDGHMITEPLMIIYLQFRKHAVFPRRKNSAGDSIWPALAVRAVQGQRRGSNGSPRDQPATRKTRQDLNVFLETVTHVSHFAERQTV